MVDFSENKKDQILILICETIKFSHSSLFIVFFRIPYSCHNHMAKECSTDEWRPCGYFRNLNLKKTLIPMSYPISILLIFISRANKFLQGLILSKATTGAGQQGQLADDCHDHSFCDFSVYLHAFWVKKFNN